jgi:uncharacterized iron-regulated membrane protein
MRPFHRWLGIGSSIVLLLAAVTGILWAYAPHLYWKPGYLEKKHSVPHPPFDSIATTHQEIARRVSQEFGASAAITSINLRSDAGMAFFEVAVLADGKESTVLFDEAGNKISPIDAALAERIARQYVPGNPTLATIVLLPQWQHRSYKIHENVWRVRFADEAESEVFLSAYSGKILEDQDKARRFHFWVMRLHQLNFFGFKKVLTIIPGSALILLVVSGLVISRKRRARRTLEKADRKAGASV